MTEFFIYVFFGSVFFVFFGLLPSRMKRHKWYEVDSAHVAMLTRKSKGRK